LQLSSTFALGASDSKKRRAAIVSCSRMVGAVNIAHLSENPGVSAQFLNETCNYISGMSHQ